MEKQIKSQLEVIDKSIKWVKKTDSMNGSKGDMAYDNLVDLRRQLKKKSYALEGNPAAAMYGESQVGKSYLISSLLSDIGTPFVIRNGDGNKYNFIEDINPPGGGSESTSLVSRFSADYQPEHSKFPIKAVLLSPADIVMVLCDSFYTDVKAIHDLVLKTESINETLNYLKNTYQNRELHQNVLEEDDILNIRDYFNSYLSKAGEVLNSNFFKEIPLLISKSQPHEWVEIFSLLWNKNETISTLFSSLIKEHQKLKFATVVYLPITAMLYKNGTLLDVKRMKEIYFDHDGIESNYKKHTDVLIIIEREKNTISIEKSYLCALTAEIVFNIPKTLLTNKPFLKETDLLDFPGARGRMTHPENLIGTEIIPELLLRGKVAYLFNRYSDAEKINVLLFCAKHTDPVQRSMPELLNNWIEKIVGDTPEKRELFVNKSKVPPLFIVGTWFNVNLQFDPQQDKKGNDSSLNYRWSQRFERTLADQLLKTDTYSWFEKWTTSKPLFQNIFLLRDFEKSESISHLYNGFNEFGEEKEVEVIKKYPDFQKDLKQSFVEFEFVKKHFKNPIESWDRAVSINEDGTSLIIQNLTIAANNIDTARIEKAQRELIHISNAILSELDKHYHDSDSDARIHKAKEIAGNIQVNLDIAFGKNPYFFGTMMKEFMLPQSEVYRIYLKKIRDIERRDVINLDQYSAIRLNVEGLNPSDNFETNLDRLREHYEKPTKEACKAYFESEGIDLNELFYGNNDRVRNFSQMLANSIEAYWFDDYLQESNETLSEILSKTDLQEIQMMLHTLFKKLKITKIIADRIRRYVDGYRNIEEVYEMISDISAEIINTFVNTIGIEYLTDSDLVDLKVANEKNNLGLILEYNDLQFEQNTRNEAAQLLTRMGNLPELLNKNPLPKEDIKLLPNYRYYIKWYNSLKVGFVSICDIPNYDVQANEQLKAIIEESMTVKY